ncbi:acyltransferase family protein [Streptomyces griseoloalbus]|uniref:Peptidoglycan/LPS O-acetylase OafA/YrhL n=1 Tax=Streptomyces griseoloalbus TaxID=67303 RepID=A0A7W8BH45_9ACTN|nr:acyltransferase [Streptomyces albaduncus]MBB5123321.1 peptidoglycan/LPS O-acetylase OafA/YrhL [Streptomyces albaduncus]GGV55603.1 membrane protein [Streptomyces griseoloalbus]GGW53013.1 membrane protein [Streptomyces albaduncus]
MTHGHTTGTGTSPEPTGPYGTPYAGNADGPPGAPYAVPQQRTNGPAHVADPAAAPAAPTKPGRDRYLDLLRSIALVRVVVYHLFGWAWLTVLFPSMGVMFALAGSLMARSLKRPALGVIRGRVRRLLPPLWIFAVVVLAMMFANGWNPSEDPDRGGTWGLVELFNYLVPIGAPPYPWHIGSKSGLLEDTWAVQAAGPLWYLRAYLWFVIASPLLLWLFRRAPWPTLLAPLGLTAIVGTGLMTIPGETGNAVTDFAVYGGCWMLGFAHHEGLLKQIPRYISVSCASLVMAFGLWWASNHLGADGWDLNDIPLAQATWSFGFVVILLQYSPSWQELPGRLAKWDKLVTLSNNRAVTIYLWHNLLIMATVPIIDLLYRLPFMQSERAVAALDGAYTIWMFALVWPLIGLMVLAVGWVEDLAAKRRPRLWPNGSTERSAGGRGRSGAAHRG